MKTKLIILALLVCSLAFGQSVTPTVGLALPAINSLSWGTVTNQNWSLVDSLLAGSQKYPTGVFRQSTDPSGSCSVTYLVISTSDPTNPTIWTCSGTWKKTVSGIQPTGAPGVVSTTGGTTATAIPLNAANGIPQLDTNAYVPLSNTNYSFKTVSDNPLFLWQQSAYGSGPAQVVVLGDSVSRGNGAGSTPALAYTYQLKSALQAKLGGTGSGMVPFNAGAAATPSLNPVSITFGGTWNEYAGAGIGGVVSGVTLNTVRQGVSSATAAFTCSASTSANIYYLTSTDTTSGFQVSIDGGSNTTYGATTTGSFTYAVQNIAIADTGSHTVNITAPASGSFYGFAVECVNSGAGVAVHNLGVSSAVSGNFSQTGALGFYPLLPNASTANILTIVELGINDAETSVTPSQYQTNLQTIVQYAQTYGPVVILDHYALGDLANSVVLPYQAARLAVAKATGAQFVAVSDRWGFNYTVANASGLMADSRHPTVKGHTDIANEILTRIDFYKVEVGQYGRFSFSLGTNTSASGTATYLPNFISLGNTYALAHGCTNPKLRVYDTSAGSAGLNASNAELDYCVAASSHNHTWWGGSTQFMNLTNNQLLLGTATVTSTATPWVMNLGGTFSSTAGANPKLQVFPGSGMGFSSSQLDYIQGSGAGSGKHAFWVNGAKVFSVTAFGIEPTSATPTFTAGTGAGTSPTITLTGGSTNNSGQVNVTTGATPTAAAAIVTITYSTAAAKQMAFCVVSPANAATSAVTAYPTTFLTSSWVLMDGASALTASTVYTWSYICH